jgi:hypothetical protein
MRKGRQSQKKKRRTYLPTFFEIVLRFLGLILENIFVVFLGFGLLMQRNGQKRYKL